MFEVLQVFVVLFLAVQGCFGRKTPEGNPNHWAVLIAGSNGWWNYRHQSDVLHAYHVLTSKGLKPENVIVMVFDDIANSKYNPFPGKIFNKPNGTDVYTGVPLDYTGEHVSRDVFLAVLSGDSTAVKGKGSGKVFKSGPKDKVFVYYSDHGASGLICMPTGDDLYADELHKVLKRHFSGGEHGELVFYLEACESGSMFTGLTGGLDLFATTAANPFESSWAFYCPGDASVSSDPNVPNPDTIGACLGDEYSIHWLEDADASDLTIETLKQQYHRVKKLTKESHVMHYGQGSIQVEEASNFIGITNLVPPKQDGVPADVEDDEEQEDDIDMYQEHHMPAIAISRLQADSQAVSAEHRRLLGQIEEAQLEVTDKFGKVELEHEEGDQELGVEEHKRHEEEEDEDDAELVDAEFVQRVPQRDAELIGMYSTLRRANLAPKLRKELEQEVLRTVELRRKVDKHASGSAQRLLLSSNGRLMGWLALHMEEQDWNKRENETVEETGASAFMLLARSGSSQMLHAFTHQVVYGANGRPDAGLPLVDDWDCLREMVQAWKVGTHTWDNGAKRHTRYFANLCNAGISPQDFARALTHNAGSTVH